MSRGHTAEEQALFEEMARRGSYEAYIDATFIDTRPVFHWNWHHQLICQYLQQVALHQIDRLIICLPPRHGKSQITVRQFPSWYLGMYPQRKVIAATYGQRLTRRMLTDANKVFHDEAYARIFPNSPLDRKVQDELVMQAGGGLFATSAGGAISGVGGNLIIVDDPTKGREAVESAHQREKMWDWWNDDLLTRTNSPSAIVLMGTRWHEDDLIGRVIKHDTQGRWHVLSLPAIAENPMHPADPRAPGELLWPSDRGGPKTMTELLTQRGNNPYGFASLYQQRPTLKEGGLFEADWFDRHFDQDPDALATKADEVVISVDASLGTTGARSDPTAIVVMARLGAKVYVLDVINRRLTYTGIKQAVGALIQRFPMAAVLIEQAAAGVPLTADLSEEHGRVIPFDHGNLRKEQRWQYPIQRMQAGTLYFPRPNHSPWRGELVDQFLAAGVTAHDDMIDAIAQACVYWANTRRVDPEKYGREMRAALKKLQGIDYARKFV